MKSVVIYDSQYGNTQALAEAIAAELKTAGPVSIENARTGTVDLPPDLELLIVGGPTQAHGMTRPLRTQLDSLASHRLDGVAAATFDTRARARARAWARAILARLSANVLLGPLGVGLLVWRVSANGLNQTYGADAASLLLVVPATLAAAWLWRVGHRLAAPLALGVGLATLYYAIAETLGGDYLRYPGNNERFFLLFLALIILSWTIAVRAWSALDASMPRPGPLAG